MIVAIYGGSFDPPHLGHEMVVKEALKSLDIETLFIIPAWLSPFKKKFFAPPKLRLEWIKTLWGDEKGVKICQNELKNQRPTTTYETVCYLHELYDITKCYLIIGADNVKDLERWGNFEELEKMVEFVVATRKDIKIPKNLKKLKINANISSSNLRNTLQKKFISPKIFKSVEKFYQKNEGEKMKENLQAIIDLLDSKKAENIQVFNMKDKDYFTDNVIIATTMGERHSNALLDDLKPVLNSINEKCLHVDASGDWAVLDLGDTIIHLMSSEYRAKYNIENFLGDFEKMREEKTEE